MLTEFACKAASCPPEKKPRARFTDDRGLYLEVSAAGSKRWFWKYAIAGKEKRLALGSYPEVKLKATREARDEARKLQRAGTDPVQRRKVDKAAALANHANTYELLARALHAKEAPTWSEVHAAKWLRLQEMYRWRRRRWLHSSGCTGARATAAMCSQACYRASAPCLTPRSTSRCAAQASPPHGDPPEKPSTEVDTA